MVTDSDWLSYTWWSVIELPGRLKITFAVCYSLTLVTTLARSNQFAWHFPGELRPDRKVFLAGWIAVLPLRPISKVLQLQLQLVKLLLSSSTLDAIRIKFNPEAANITFICFGHFNRLSVNKFYFNAKSCSYSLSRLYRGNFLLLLCIWLYSNIFFHGIDIVSPAASRNVIC